MKLIKFKSLFDKKRKKLLSSKTCKQNRTLKKLISRAPSAVEKVKFEKKFISKLSIHMRKAYNLKRLWVWSSVKEVEFRKLWDLGLMQTMDFGYFFPNTFVSDVNRLIFSSDYVIFEGFDVLYRIFVMIIVGEFL